MADRLTPREEMMLDALEKANWFIQAMYGGESLAVAFCLKTLIPVIEKAAAIRAEARLPR